MTVRTIRAFLAGIGVAYLFDPRQGKGRRRVLRARGLVATPARAVDDGTVVQRIRSEALRDVGVSTSDVDVDVRDGVAVLRGAVATRSLADDLVARVRGVPGVHDVESALDVVGPPASR